MSTTPKTYTLAGPGTPTPLAKLKVTFGAPPAPTEEERRSMFMQGCKRLGADPAKLKELEGVENELQILVEQLETKAVDHVALAAKKAGAAAFKALGKDAFPDGLPEAIQFARKSLPLAAAWARFERDADERLAASRQANDTRKRFWREAESLASTVAHFTRQTGDHGRMLDEVIHAGRG